MISGLNRTDIGFNVIEDFIQTDAAVNPLIGVRLILMADY